MYNASECILGLQTILAVQEQVALTTGSNDTFPLCDPEKYGTSTDAVFLFFAGTLVLFMQVRWQMPRLLLVVG
jgi:hypothetical protein